MAKVSATLITRFIVAMKKNYCAYIELWSVLEALKYARNLGFWTVKVNVDSLVLLLIVVVKMGVVS